MTAEIVIMNKSAIALAADSAVTVRSSSERGKVFNTANKVFALSKFAPIGIMIFGDANIMGIPWEIVIKMYREVLGTTKLDTVEAYCKSFFEYLDNFPVENEAEKDHILGMVYFICNSIQGELDEWVKTQLQVQSEVPVSEIHVKLQQLISEKDSRFEQFANDNGLFSQEDRKMLLDQYHDEINEFSGSFFEKYQLTEEDKLRIRTAVINVSCIGPNDSGIVIAGFGEKEYYPHCRSFNVTGIIAKRAVKKETEHRRSDISFKKNSQIIPFAQSEQVQAFIFGISPKLHDFMDKYFGGVFGAQGDIATKIKESIGARLTASEEEKEAFYSQVDNICQGAYSVAMDQFVGTAFELHTHPITNATTFLNKDELAKMAEALVNLESFRQQVVLGDETVGGPIDVAVITKGDGLIWIKRKHYFRPELNHHFFENYFEKKYMENSNVNNS